ncbi:Methyl-accepting chemotaxis protein [Cyclonatronum proteinivorum]|uniref:Methyl-accepting chemotaxis protein n=1 Tax=Cyclonatronum proteinivorum TaxID=1457365 RepID=A0A345UKZ6_9BACT|nr:methyl-accepting chemotaxis protein [Cyclonatronum proteinivorum]AXJ01148.1 Methyl-accepting chemotaxis protein [Cyclonatronum proteinivorum]
MNASNLSFTGKIITAGALLVGVFVLVFLYLNSNLRTLSNLADELDEMTELFDETSRISDLNSRIFILQFEALVSTAEREQKVAESERLIERLEVAVRSLRARAQNGIAATDEIEQLIPLLNTMLDEYRQSNQHLRTVTIGTGAAIDAFQDEDFRIYEQVYAAILVLQDAIFESREELRETADLQKAASGFAMLIAAFVLIGLTAVSVWFLYRTMGRITAELKTSIQVLGTSAAEIQTTVTEISTGATETATAIAETTSTVEEVRQTASVASDRAQNLQETSQKSASMGDEGLEASRIVVDGMAKIDQQMKVVEKAITRLSEQNRSIGEITTTVSDIADQSNLLGVNASIEAAKAGEHGKGFSVVAQEIKSLAEQSKKSAAQIKTILNDIQKSVSDTAEAIRTGSSTVEEGTQTVLQERKILEALIESIDEALDASIQIASSSQQQLAGMEQIAPAMENIRVASDQNVTGSHQTRQAIQELNELAQNLEQTIEKYKL